MKRILVTLTAIFFAFQLSAQQNEAKVRKITVDEAVLLATDNNISIKIQKSKLNTLKRKNTFSWGSVGPSASLSGGMQIPLQKQTASLPDYSYNAEVRLGLTLTPALYTSIKEAKLRYENGKTSYEDAVREVEVSVRKLFYNLLYTQEKINLSRRNMETARIRYENNRDKYNRGQLSELALLQSQYNYESQRPTIESDEIAYQNNFASFKQALGIPQDEEIQLEGSLSAAVPKGEISVSQTVEELPSIKKSKASLELQKNTLLAQRFTAYGPSIGASYSYGKSGSSQTKSFDELITSGNSISLSVSLPLDGLIPWSTRASNIAELKAGIKELELQLENEKTSASLNLQNSIKNIQQKQNQLELLERNVDLAQRTYDMTLTSYNHGSSDLLTLQSSSDSLLKAKTDREYGLYNLISAVLDLENTLGLPFGTLGRNQE